MADLTAFHEMYDEQEKLLDIFDNRPDHTPLFFLVHSTVPDTGYDTSSFNNSRLSRFGYLRISAWYLRSQVGISEKI